MDRRTQDFTVIVYGAREHRSQLHWLCGFLWVISRAISSHLSSYIHNIYTQTHAQTHAQPQPHNVHQSLTQFCNLVSLHEPLDTQKMVFSVYSLILSRLVGNQYHSRCPGEELIHYTQRISYSISVQFSPRTRAQWHSSNIFRIIHSFLAIPFLTPPSLKENAKCHVILHQRMMDSLIWEGSWRWCIKGPEDSKAQRDGLVVLCDTLNQDNRIIVLVFRDSSLFNHIPVLCHHPVPLSRGDSRPHSRVLATACEFITLKK